LQTLPTTVPRAWIWSPPTGERRRLQTVEHRRQLGFDEVGPGREGADAPATVARVDAAEVSDCRDVEHVLDRGPTDPRRVVVRRPGDDDPRRATRAPLASASSASSSRIGEEGHPAALTPRRAAARARRGSRWRPDPSPAG
jgi:hypothetical protein